MLAKEGHVQSEDFLKNASASGRREQRTARRVDGDSLEAHVERLVEPWVRQDHVRGVVDDDTPLREDDHAIAIAQCRFEVVHHHDEDSIVGDGMQAVEEFQPMPDVEPCTRFVREEDGGLCDENRCEQGSGSLTSREARPAPVPERLELVVANHRVDAGPGPSRSTGSEFDDLQHREVPRGLEILRHVSDEAAARLRRQCQHPLAIERHVARSGRPKPGEVPQERRLAGSVRAHEPDERARFERHGEAVDEGLAIVFDTEIRYLERHYALSLRPSRMRKNGPPTMAVIMPSGTSAGGSNDRASPSHTSTIAAPMAALAGRSTL